MNDGLYGTRGWLSAIFIALTLVFPAVSPGQNGSSTESHAASPKVPDEPVLDLGPGITPPRVIHQVVPKTGEGTDGFRVSGIVVIGLVVDSAGMPRDVHIIRSLDKDLDRNAVEAVQQWRFEPARKDNHPVAVRTSIEVRFRDL